jgi:hypothetical protein
MDRHVVPHRDDEWVHLHLLVPYAWGHYCGGSRIST